MGFPGLLKKECVEILCICTNHSNMKIEPKYLTKSDIQLNPNIMRTKND